jgi:hypothetical protein
VRVRSTWTIVLIAAERVRPWLEDLTQGSSVQTHVPDCLVYLCQREGATLVVELVAGGGEGGNITSTEKLMSPHPEKCLE